MKSLLKILNRFVKVDKVMEEGLLSHTKTKVYDAREWILKEGEFSDCVFFIQSGGIYYYLIDSEGQENVLDFFFENDFFTDLHSFHTGETSKYYIKTLERSVIHIIPKYHLDRLLEEDLRWERIVRLLMQEIFLKEDSYKQYMNTLSNEEHYLKLVEFRPNIIQRVPQYMVASYLNITPEGLSKIRKRLRKK